MTIQSHTFDITKIAGVGRNSRLPSGAPSLTGTTLKTTADGMALGAMHNSFQSGASYLAWTGSSYETGIISSIGGLITWNNAAHNSSDFWAPVCVWNPVNKQPYWITDRTSAAQTTECVALMTYDPQTHTFIRLPRVEQGGAWGSPHVYGRWALDAGRQKIYRRQGDLVWSFDIPTGSWSSASGRSPQWDEAIAMHEEMGELLFMDAGNVKAWNPDTNVTRTIGARAGHTATHAHAHYNWTRQEWCMMFGDSGAQMTIVNAAGDIIPVTIPAEAYGNHSSMFGFYDPVTGHYLIANNKSTLYEYSPDADQWAQVSTNWFEAVYHGPLIAPIPDLGVSMILHRDRGARLYKHEAQL